MQVEFLLALAIEVKQLVASLAPKPAPADSLRRAPVRGLLVESAAPAALPLAPVAGPLAVAAPVTCVAAPAVEVRRDEPALAARAPASAPLRRPVDLAPLSGDEWLLRMRLSERVRNKLETARALASHTIVDGSWKDVLEAALDCHIEKLEKRRAAKPSASASERLRR